MNASDLNFSIAPVLPANLAQIQELAHAIWPGYYSSIISMAQIDFMLAALYTPEALRAQQQNGQQFFSANLNGNMVGFMGLTLMESSRLKIDKLYLLSNFRGMGLGKMLLNFAFDEARKQNASTVFLNVNRHNQSLLFYQAYGFEISETVDIPFGPFWLNDFIMEKQL